VSTMTTEIESDVDGYSAPSKYSARARRRVDAYHEALRERYALHELEQPFVLDGQTRRPPRY
jgi:hypothetical protein